MQVFTSFVARKSNLLLRVVALMLCVVCTVMLLSQTVFAQNTYIITDGNYVKVHSTYTTDPEQILNEAGVELSEDDIYTTQPGDGVEEITIQRGQIISVNYCGEEFKVCSYGETVNQLLKRLQLYVGPEHVLHANPNAVTYDGMNLVIDLVEESGRYYFEEIPYGSTYCYNPTLPADYRQVVKPGTPGKLFCTAEAVMVNGVEESCNLKSQTVFADPVNEIVVVGTGEKLGGHKKTPAVGDGVLVTAEGKILYFDQVINSKATAYTKTDPGCNDITATGTRVHEGVVAVDPRVIPYGTEMFIVSNDGKYVYGHARAEDCGGAIKNTRIDLYYDTTAECLKFGIRNCTVYILAD